MLEESDSGCEATGGAAALRTHPAATRSSREEANSSNSRTRAVDAEGIADSPEHEERFRSLKSNYKKRKSRHGSDGYRPTADPPGAWDTIESISIIHGRETL